MTLRSLLLTAIVVAIADPTPRPNPASPTAEPEPPLPAEEAPSPAEGWSDPVVVQGEHVPVRDVLKAWKAAGKPRHAQVAATEPHAVLYGNLGAIRQQTGADVSRVDGATLSHGFETTSVVRVTPGDHEVMLRFRLGTSFVSEEYLVATMSFDAGRIYRFAAITEGGIFKKRAVIVVQSTDDRSRVPAEP